MAEFTQGMILPTANGVATPQSTSQSKAKTDKTQVSAAETHNTVNGWRSRFEGTDQR